MLVSTNENYETSLFRSGRHAKIIEGKVSFNSKHNGLRPEFLCVNNNLIYVTFLYGNRVHLAVIELDELGKLKSSRDYHNTNPNYTDNDVLVDPKIYLDGKRLNLLCFKEHGRLLWTYTKMPAMWLSDSFINNHEVTLNKESVTADTGRYLYLVDSSRKLRSNLDSAIVLLDKQDHSIRKISVDIPKEVHIVTSVDYSAGENEEDGVPKLYVVAKTGTEGEVYHRHRLYSVSIDPDGSLRDWICLARIPDGLFKVKCLCRKGGIYILGNKNKKDKTVITEEDVYLPKATKITEQNGEVLVYKLTPTISRGTRCDLYGKIMVDNKDVRYDTLFKSADFLYLVNYLSEEVLWIEL